MTGRPSVVRNQGWLLFSAVFGMGSTLAMTIIVGRNAPLETLGFFALVGAILSLARDVTDLGSSAVATREAARDPEREPVILGQLLAWRLVLSAILALGCVALALRRGATVESALLVCAGLAILVAFNNGLFAVFQVRQQQSVPAALNAWGYAIALVAAGLVLALGANPLLFAAIIILREAAIALANRVLALRRLGGAPRVGAALAGFRQWVLSALSIYAVAALCWHILLNSGTFVVELTMPGEALGTYMAAFRLATPLFGLGWLLTAPLVAVFAVAAHRDTAVFGRQTETALVLALGTGLLLGTIGAVFSDAIIALIYGKALSGATGEIAGDTLRWFMLAFAATLVAAVCAPALLAKGEEATLARIAFGFMLVSLLGTVLAAAQEDLTLIAAAIAIGMSASAIAATIRLGRLPHRRLVLSALPALLALLLCSLVPTDWPPVAQLAVGSLLALGGLAVIWLQPGMADYRKEQDDLAALAAAANARDKAGNA